MKIHKPDDVLILLGYHATGGQPTLIVTLGYAVEPDGTRVTEQAIWPWLLPQFPAEPFDTASKKRRRGFGVAGDAFAPPGRSVQALAVHACVGDIEKTLHVHGERRWIAATLGYKPGGAQTFRRMPLDLTRSFGGKDYAHNPHGMGLATPFEGAPLPHVEHANAPLLSPGDTPEPATFGPLPQGSPARTRYLGRFDENWRRTRFPWLPDDTDPRWFDAFPQDQCRDGYWRGDEAWTVAGMHATQPQVQGRLPGLRPRLLVRQASDTGDVMREANLDLDTVWLFPNAERSLVLYRAQIPVRHEDATDIAALGIFTETLTEPAQPATHWQTVWQAEEAPAPAPAVAAPIAQPQADADALRAKAQAQMAAMADSIWQTLEQAHADALTQAAQVMKTHGLPFDPAAHAFPARTALVAPPAPATPLAPTFAADLRREIDASLAAARDDAEQALRRVAQESGQDGEALVRLARNPPPQPAVSVREHIERAGLPKAEKAQALERLSAFEAEMAALDTRIAQLDTDIAALHGRTAAASGAQAVAAGAREAVDEALAAARVDGRERAARSRDDVLQRHADGQSLSWSLLQDLDFSGTALDGIDLSHSVLQRCQFTSASLTGARLDHTSLEDCTLDGAALTDASLRSLLMKGGTAADARLAGANLDEAQVSGTDFTGADLTRATLRRAALSDCRLAQAVLSEADATAAGFAACDFTGVRAEAAILAQARLDACVLEQAHFVRANLAGATLATARGARTNFQQADLRALRLDSACALHAPHFAQAQLADASLQDSSLVAANFHEADLARAFIKNCDLSQSDGWRARAVRADFHGSRLTGASWVAANLMQASLYKAVLEDLDLSGANLHAAQTRTAQVRGVRLDAALLTRCHLLEEHARD